MIRPFLFILLILAVVIPSFASFPCPAESALLERKDDSQWMKACRDGTGKLHGPFEIWTRVPADREANPTFRKTTEGRYARGMRVGVWTYWNIEGVKVAEQVLP